MSKVFELILDNFEVLNLNMSFVLLNKVKILRSPHAHLFVFSCICTSKFLAFIKKFCSCNEQIFTNLKFHIASILKGYKTACEVYPLADEQRSRVT